MSKNSTRRNFLQTTAALCTTGYLVSGANPNPGWAADFRSNNEQPGVAFIGAGIRFHSYHSREALKFGPCVSICDVDSHQLGRGLQVAIENHRQNDRPITIDAVEDYRAVLDNKDVDVVIIGTVDHWHTKIVIDAMKAGKDVYCEKPVTLTVREGQQILQAQKDSGKIIQVGTQQRTEFDKRFAKAAALMRANRIGNHRLTTVAIGGSPSCDSLPVCEPPSNLNWDMWLGQCPMVPYRAGSKVAHEKGWGAGFPHSRTHRYYRWFYEYSGGKLTDWGAHHMDIALMGHDKLGDEIGLVKIKPLEVTHPVELDKNGMPTLDDRFNTASAFKVELAFADGTKMHVRHNADDLGFGNGVMFAGAASRFLVNRSKLVGRPVEDLESNPLADDSLSELYPYDPMTRDGFGKPGFHMRDFMECAKSGKQPSSDMQSHHRMLNLCHSINVALRLSREVIYDPKTETFVNDEQANSFLQREQRKGYETG
ncbi:Gfo/Idh/MocA family oxidoreductase [bacterium]|nr:Gfo/Idh/MocA family oxidoreductase [bacterium]